MLKIALVGLPGTGKSRLAAALSDALKASGWPAAIALIDTPGLPPDLAGHDLTLLMGLDTSASPPAAAQEAADLLIRAALAGAGIAYQVIYGLAEERLRHALHACESPLKQATPPAAAQSGSIAGKEKSKKGQPWTWMCDKCSDPICEHRLLTALLARRASTA